MQIIISGTSAHYCYLHECISGQKLLFFFFFYPSTLSVLLFVLSRSAVSPLPSFTQQATLKHTLSFSPVNIHRDRPAIANSFGSISFSLTFSPPSSLSHCISVSLFPLISVGSPGINRQFQSSPARFTLFCSQ